jgi:hypothetical protein
MTRALFAVAVGLGCGCAAHPSPALPTQAEWRAARAWLGELRASQPVLPFGAIVRVELRDPRSGRALSARGAVAVDPHRAMRMVLLGPAGSTALDVWATADLWRFEAPAAQMLRRGGQDDDPTLPIGFFRWWFLAPLDGRLLTAVAGTGSERFILRRGADIIDLTDTQDGTGHVVTASRRAQGWVDRIDFRGAALGAEPGDRATYDHEASGVHVEVLVESLSGTPEPAAFADPDGPGGERVGR